MRRERGSTRINVIDAGGLIDWILLPRVTVRCVDIQAAAMAKNTHTHATSPTHPTQRAVLIYRQDSLLDYPHSIPKSSLIDFYSPSLCYFADRARNSCLSVLNSTVT